MQKVLENALGPEPEFDPKIDFETLDVALEKIRNQIVPLLDFDVQTILESFQKQGKSYEKTRRVKKPLIDRKIFPF
jgi:hypothetical protein